MSSLKSTLQQLERRSDLYIFKRKQDFILLLGQYELKEQALESLNQLNLEGTAWIRQWHQIDRDNIEPLAINHVISM
ncbi:MAG: hypothetical protein ISP86_02595 [Shewanellaceae bacterium]|nr:hypothetical protein [Shewanellaceae bacterium]